MIVADFKINYRKEDMHNEKFKQRVRKNLSGQG